MSSSRMTEIITRRHPDFAKLPLVEQRKVLDKGPNNLDLAIADATMRQQWKPPYRQLQDALDAVENMTKWSKTKIIDAIPDDHIDVIAVRVKRANDYLKKIQAELAQRNSVPPIDVE